MIYVFRVAPYAQYEFEADNAGEAMEMCNRHVMDGLNVGLYAWYDAVEPNVFNLGLGNNFD